MKSRTQKRIEEYMSMRNLLTYHEAVEKARIDHLKYLKDLFVNLIKEYGEIDGKKIFILMLGNSIQYRDLIINSGDFFFCESDFSKTR